MLKTPPLILILIYNMNNEREKKIEMEDSSYLPWAAYM